MPPRPNYALRRLLVFGTALVVLAGLAVGLTALVRSSRTAPCTLSVSGGERTVEVETDQAERVASAAAAAVRRGDGLDRAHRAVARALAGGDPSVEDARDARPLAVALTGRRPAAFSCTHGGAEEEAPDELRDNGLVARADAVRRDVQAAFEGPPVGGFAPGGVSTGHMPGSAHYEGRAVDVFFRPVNKANKERGWALAQYLVAHADRLQVETVIYDDRIWTHRRGKEGWRDYDVDTSGEDPETAAILEHRDHVHVDVAD